MKEFGMDQRFATHFLLLILGITIFAMAQDQLQCVTDQPLQGEQSCTGNWICPSNANCNHTVCRCKKGYYQCKKKGSLYCKDLNECNKTHGCGNGATCKNTVGSYYCICDKRNTSYFCPSTRKQDYCEGLTCPGGTSTQNVDECRSRTHHCGPHTTCEDAPDAYYCMCDGGFLKDNKTKFCPSNNHTENTCTDIDECSNKPDICGSTLLCRNTPGSYECTCAAEFRNISNTCQDIDECSEKPDICGSNAICTNTLGSYKCDCADGYVSESNTCVAKKVQDACEHRSSPLLEECIRTNSQDASCMVLKAAFALLNTTCNSNSNITKEEAIKKVEQDTNQLSNTFNLLSNSSSTANNPETSVIATTILKTMETVILKSFIDIPRNQTISTPQINASMKVSRDICTTDVPSFILTVNENLMEVPCSFRDTDGAIFIVYKDLDATFNGNEALSSRKDNDEAKVNSKVVTGAITFNLTSEVSFTLALIQVLRPSFSPNCVFWDPENNKWSTNGCYIKDNNKTHITCACNHLSSFAVLMAPSGHKDDYILTIISRVGLSLSLFCLLLSLLTFILCRPLRSVHTSVLTAMWSCLFLGQALFLVGLHQTGYKVVCSVIAGGLQLLFLCAFCWMSIESFLLFMTVRNLRAVNYMTSRRSNFPLMCSMGFGVPAVIVGISAAIQPDGYGTDTYCWLRPQSTIWSFIGPVAIFIITNTILLILTITFLRIRLATLNTNVSTLKNNRILTFKALAQVFILGCTWVIGYFQFGSHSLVIAYIFTICNSLQGVYIFLVHCLFNNQVKQEYRKVFFRPWKRGKPSSSDGSTPNTGTKSMNLTEITKPVNTEQSSEAEKAVHWQ
ncbi:adhesion G protein-coupled receptor E3-like [Dendropsophus ebraccatus]|uniref:adhesion G protein-coupled receptor E3-like n=1 Tax=Dendropsophus ebraccatus TaxID=150705 RepID=UPI0038321DE3